MCVPDGLSPLTVPPLVTCMLSTQLVNVLGCRNLGFVLDELLAISDDCVDLCLLDASKWIDGGQIMLLVEGQRCK